MLEQARKLAEEFSEATQRRIASVFSSAYKGKSGRQQFSVQKVKQLKLSY